MSVPANTPGAQQAGESPRESIWGTKLGWLTGADAEGRLLVDFEGNREGPLPGRRTISLTSEQLRSAVELRQRAVLLFENGDPRLPLVVGMEQVSSPTPLLDAMLDSSRAEAPAETGMEAELERPAAPTEAHVDGQRVVIEGKDEIVLRCGQASITLRRNGRVVLKGVHLETHATGVNRIKGGSVQIN